MSHEQTAKQLMDALPSGKGLESDPELTGGIMLKTWPGGVSKIAASYRSSGCLEIPTQAAVPAIPEGQAGKGKYTELI